MSLIMVFTLLQTRLKQSGWYVWHHAPKKTDICMFHGYNKATIIGNIQMV